jgi:hypothetical protein
VHAQSPCLRYRSSRPRLSYSRNEWEWRLRVIHVYPIRCADCKYWFLWFSLYEVMFLLC